MPDDEKGRLSRLAARSMADAFDNPSPPAPDKWEGVPTVRDHWVNTVSGRKVSLVTPWEDQIEIGDIATGLSNIGRYNGQTGNFYSVAEHCYWVSMLVPQTGVLPLYGLLHDAAEAYVGDMVTPLKAMLPEYRAIEDNLLDVIFSRYELDMPIPEEVHEVDRRILANEAEVLFKKNDEWVIPFEPFPQLKLELLYPPRAAAWFLSRFDQLRRIGP